MPFLVLLPPSKSTEPGGSVQPWQPDVAPHPLAPTRRRVYEAALAATRDRKAFGVAVEAGGELLDEAVTDLHEATRRPARAAGERYAGLLHTTAGYAGMGPGDRRRYAAHVRVLSGLLGLVAPDEPIPSYRLPMGASLPDVGPLASLWRDPVTAEVERQADGALIWDLLSAEYRRAFRPARGDRIHEVRFERRAATGWRAAPSAIGKQLKGAFARHVALDGLASVEAVATTLDIDGYRFHEVRGAGPRTVVFRQPGAS